MNVIGALFRRELQSYFSTPVAFVFILIFLLLMGTSTFYLGIFYERGQADLGPFIIFHPRSSPLLLPANATSHWAAERKTAVLDL